MTNNIKAKQNKKIKMCMEERVRFSVALHKAASIQSQLSAQRRSRTGRTVRRTPPPKDSN